MKNSGIVLIVEDSKRILEINRRVLASDDCEVHTATTLKEARKILQTVSPDVAILDIILPDGNGLDFASELRKVCRASIIFLTAKTGPENEKAGLTEGAVQYITKPYNVDTFRMIVKNLLADIVNNRTPSPISLLDDCDIKIARLKSGGALTKTIADELSVSVSCVKSRLRKIYKTLEITGDIKGKQSMLAEALTKCGAGR